MARSAFGLPTINDLNLQGRVLRNTAWSHQTIVQYEVGDVCVYNERWYVCISQSDASVDAARIPSNSAYWTKVGSDGLLSGTGVPAQSLGSVGELYFRTSNGEYYLKSKLVSTIDWTITDGSLLDNVVYFDEFTDNDNDDIFSLTTTAGLSAIQYRTTRTGASQIQEPALNESGVRGAVNIAPDLSPLRQIYIYIDETVSYTNETRAAAIQTVLSSIDGDITPRDLFGPTTLNAVPQGTFSTDGATITFTSNDASKVLTVVPVTNETGITMAVDNSLSSWGVVYTPSGGGTSSTLLTEFGFTEVLGTSELTLNTAGSFTDAHPPISVVLSSSKFSDTNLTDDEGRVLKIQLINQPTLQSGFSTTTAAKYTNYFINTSGQNTSQATNEFAAQVNAGAAVNILGNATGATWGITAEVLDAAAGTVKLSKDGVAFTLSVVNLETGFNAASTDTDNVTVSGQDFVKDKPTVYDSDIYLFTSDTALSTTTSTPTPDDNSDFLNLSEDDLSNYYTKEDVVALLSGYYTKTEANTLFYNKTESATRFYTQTEVNNLVQDAIDNEGSSWIDYAGGIADRNAQVITGDTTVIPYNKKLDDTYSYYREIVRNATTYTDKFYLEYIGGTLSTLLRTRGE